MISRFLTRITERLWKYNVNHSPDSIIDTADDGRVFYQANSGVIYLIDPKTGKFEKPYR